ncbi:uncharacterized protein LY89DRAFT_552487, partial [Mollisia scopiformis]
GDGFTEAELAAAIDPLNRPWNPEREYEESSIGQLVPGPRAVTFMGRVVHLNTFFGHHPKQPRAAGFHSIILKDDSAAILIKLYFAQDLYPLKLGQLLTCWTAFISDASKPGGKIIPSVIVGANMFPGRATSDHIMIHTNESSESICRAPLEYRKTQPLPGLMTLDSWINGGHDGIVGAKILVCVRSIGGKKVIEKKDGSKSELSDVMVFDHTASAKLTVWNRMIDGIGDWQAGKTVLLISNPGYKLAYIGNKGSIAILPQTLVDVNPDFPDADWLMKYAVGLTKKESLCLEFPEDIWDIEAAEYGVCRNLYTLAELDRWVRTEELPQFTGFINVTIIEMSLVKLYRQRMLMCSECCGVPVYSMSMTTTCGNCSKVVNLYLNPKIMGLLLDETGCIAPGKLLWSPRAWEILFGRPIKEVTEMTLEEVKSFEQRAMFMRLHLVFGW